MAADAIGEPQWLDVKNFLGILRHYIPPGHLFCTPHFSLFDAMSAVEVGDPKLDICATRLEEIFESRCNLVKV
jgi:Mak10 subunit, NatC N(alpha)-terminal acetyltransferase